VGDGFIGEDQFGLLEEGAGDGDSLLFTAGELADEVVLVGIEAEGLEAAGGAGFFMGGQSEECAPPRMTGEGTCEGVLEGGGVASEVELLKDEAEAITEGGWGMMAQVLAAVGDGAGAGRVEASERFEERGLADPRRADDCDELAAGDGEVEITDKDLAAAFDGQGIEVEVGWGGGWRG
jgi:hypothetical protein